MSQKGRLRRLDAGVRWLETEGTYIRIEGLVKSLEMLLDIADRADADPVFAARWKETFPSVVLPPPRRKAAPPRPQPEPAPPRECAPEPAPAPQPVIVPEAPQSPKVESPPPVIEARAQRFRRLARPSPCRECRPRRRPRTWRSGPSIGANEGRGIISM